MLLILILTGVETQLRAQENTVISWREAQRQEEKWFSGKEAGRIADNVMLYQNNNGGWLKNIDMAAPLNEVRKSQLRKEKVLKSGTTIDNGATHTQLRYLAKVFTATGKENHKNSFLKGVDYLLAAQYKNGAGRNSIL